MAQKGRDTTWSSGGRSARPADPFLHLLLLFGLFTVTPGEVSDPTESTAVDSLLRRVGLLSLLVSLSLPVPRMLPIVAVLGTSAVCPRVIAPPPCAPCARVPSVSSGSGVDARIMARIESGSKAFGALRGDASSPRRRSQLRSGYCCGH